jgi:superfamily I DNA and/or RNA helicase
MYATLPKSPSEYLAANIHDLHLNVKLMEDKRFSSGLKHALGLEGFTFYPRLKTPRTPSVEMDNSQLRAWEAAVNPSNPIALVQGPPGTGKTFVLEQTLRELCKQGLRVLTAAPSNTAIDNICRRISDLPVLRFGKKLKSISPDVADHCWIGRKNAVDRFIKMRKKYSGGIYAGTNVGLLKDQIVQDDMERNGKYDAVVFDEAGMSNLEEFLLCANFGKRVILFGDHQQLPPFPLPHIVLEKLKEKFETIPRHLSSSTGISALEYLAEQRKIPVILLGNSYRCQNPRLLRFASTLFYDACVRTSSNAEYYQLAYHERERRYPASTMRLYSTSNLREESRREQLCFDGRKPGLANQTEALICADLFYEAASKYPLEEITIIAPYRKQISLLRETLSLAKFRKIKPERKLTDGQWQNFLFSRIATVDSFQGGESDVVIICYVRSNEAEGIGFIDNPNRINVAHTRCRREMHIVGDMDCLKRQAQSNIFERLERAFKRDGEILNAPGKYNIL